MRLVHNFPRSSDDYTTRIEYSTASCNQFFQWAHRCNHFALVRDLNGRRVPSLLSGTSSKCYWSTRIGRHSEAFSKTALQPRCSFTLVIHAIIDDQYPPVRPSISSPDRPSVQVIVRPSDRASIRPSFRPSVRPSVAISSVRPSFRPSAAHSDQNVGVLSFAGVHVFKCDVCNIL